LLNKTFILLHDFSRTIYHNAFLMPTIWNILYTAYALYISYSLIVNCVYNLYILYISYITIIMLA